MSESAKNQMNARSKVKSLAKAKVEPCDNAGVDLSPFPQSMAKGVAQKWRSTALKPLSIECCLRASPCILSFLVATLKQIFSKQALRGYP